MEANPGRVGSTAVPALTGVHRVINPGSVRPSPVRSTHPPTDIAGTSQEVPATPGGWVEREYCPSTTLGGAFTIVANATTRPIPRLAGPLYPRSDGLPNALPDLRGDDRGIQPSRAVETAPRAPGRPPRAARPLQRRPTRCGSVSPSCCRWIRSRYCVLWTPPSDDAACRSCCPRGPS